jgi:hypothetical protein
VLWEQATGAGAAGGRSRGALSHAPAKIASGAGVKTVPSVCVRGEIGTGGDAGARFIAQWHAPPVLPQRISKTRSPQQVVRSINRQHGACRHAEAEPDAAGSAHGNCC